MKKLSTFLLSIFLLLISVNVEALTIKFATLAPKGSPWYNIFRDMAEEWKRISNGKIQMRIYAGGVAGDESDMVRKMRIGQLHAAGVSSIGLSDIVSDIAVMELPMFITNYDELDYILKKVSKRFEEKLGAKGFNVLNWGEAGWVHLFSQKPVIYPDDLKAQTMFVWGERSPANDAWKRKGIRVLAISPTDIYTMLRAKKINAFATTPIAALSFQWFTLAKEMTDMKLAPLIGALIISDRTWEKIPTKLRPELEEAARKAGKRLKIEIRRLEKESIEVMKSHGLVVNHIPDEAMAVWVKFAEDEYPGLLNTSSLEEIFIEAKKYRDEVRHRK